MTGPPQCSPSGMWNPLWIRSSRGSAFPALRHFTTPCSMVRLSGSTCQNSGVQARIFSRASVAARLTAMPMDQQERLATVC